MKIFTKILNFFRDLNSCLRKEKPFCNAGMLSIPRRVAHTDNHRLVVLTVFPTYRRVVFRSIKVSSCYIYPAECQNHKGLCFYQPMRSRGGLEELSFNEVLPSRSQSTEPLQVVFYIETKFPPRDLDFVKITVDAIPNFMSTSCELELFESTYLDDDD